MNALGTLVRFRLRRDRVVGTVWVVVVALSILFVVAALASTYGTRELRIGVIEVLTTNPTLLAVRQAEASVAITRAAGTPVSRGSTFARATQQAVDELLTLVQENRR